MSKRKKPGIWLIALVAFFLYCAYVTIDQQKVINSKEMELKNIQEKIKAEEKLNAELKKQKEMINSDEYIEKVAREKLGMVKKNEKVFIDMNK